MLVTETERLVIRRLTADDAQFVLDLLNDPDWLQFIGDKHVHTLDDARNYIDQEATLKYSERPLGLNLVELKNGAVPIGICGFKKRDYLEHPDLGFAFLTTYRGQGYALEACQGLLTQLFLDAFNGKDLNPLHVYAITTQDNHSSMRLLEKLGFGFRRVVALPRSTTELRLYAVIMEAVNAVT